MSSPAPGVSGALHSEDSFPEHSEDTPGVVTIPCFGCRADLLVPAAGTGYACGACGEQRQLRQCPRCREIVHVLDSDEQHKIKCSSCNFEARWSKWDYWMGSAGQYAACVAHAQQPQSARNTLIGVVIAATGFPPLAPGVGCRLDFEPRAINVFGRAPGKGYEQVASVTDEQTRFLRVGGRGAITSTRGGGWFGGGFGVTGMAEGALLAAAMNALTTRTKTSIETIVNLNGGDRELMMLTSEVTPAVLQVRLAPVFARLDDLKNAALPTAAPSVDPVQRIEQLGALRDKGLLSQDEFDAAKQSLLRSIAGSD